MCVKNPRPIPMITNKTVCGTRIFLAQNNAKLEMPSMMNIANVVSMVIMIVPPTASSFGAAELATIR